MSDRWISKKSWSLATIDGKVHVLRRGGVFAKEGLADDEVMYRSVAVAKDFDEGLLILRALRAGAS